MTPKIIHCFWEGDNAPPYPSKWPDVATGYKFTMWTADLLQKICDFDISHLPPVGKSEVCRHMAIYRFGGIYLDCDIELLKDPSPWLKLGTFVAVEAFPVFANAAVSGGPAGNPFNLAMAKGVLEAYNSGLNPAEAGPQLLTKSLKNMGITIRRHRRGNGRIKTIPNHEWAPWNWNEKPCDPKGAICVHHWEKNW
jgi:hypothetical protein